MTTRNEINQLADLVASRYDQFRVRKIVIYVTIVATILLIVCSLFWVGRGFAVPLILPIILLAIATLSIWRLYQRSRMQKGEALAVIDEHFRLKDGAVTAAYLANEGVDSNATKLQWNWLQPRLESCDASTIHEAFPVKAAVVAGCLTAAAFVLCIWPASEDVLAAEEAANEMQIRVGETKEDLEKLFDELEKAADSEDEIEGLKLDEFREMVKAIDHDSDRSEIARQFARIQKKVRESSQALEQKRDEETVKLAGQELAKARGHRGA